MADTIKPPYKIAWGESGQTGDTPADARISQGWLAEVPSFQLFNWLLERDGQFNKHVNEEGIAKWDEDTEYSQFAIVKDVLVPEQLYQRRALAGAGGMPPSSNPADWSPWPPAHGDSLPITGGTMTGNLVMGAATTIRGTYATSQTENMLRMDNSGSTHVGASSVGKLLFYGTATPSVVIGANTTDIWHTSGSLPTNIPAQTAALIINSGGLQVIAGASNMQALTLNGNLGFLGGGNISGVNNISLSGGLNLNNSALINATTINASGQITSGAGLSVNGPIVTATTGTFSGEIIAGATGGNVGSLTRRDAYAQPTLGGTLKARLAGNNLFLTNNGANP